MFTLFSYIKLNKTLRNTSIKIELGVFNYLRLKCIMMRIVVLNVSMVLSECLRLKNIHLPTEQIIFN